MSLLRIFGRWKVYMFDYRDNNPFRPLLTRHMLANHLAKALAPATTPGGRGGVLTTVRFCPHFLTEDLLSLLMLPFEPGQCACFDTDGTAKPASPYPSSEYHNHRPRVRSQLAKRMLPLPYNC